MGNIFMQSNLIGIFTLLKKNRRYKNSLSRGRLNDILISTSLIYCEKEMRKYKKMAQLVQGRAKIIMIIVVQSNVEGCNLINHKHERRLHDMILPI